MRVLLRHRRIVLALVAAAVGWSTPVQPPDLARFADLGQQVLTGQLARVYATPWNQAGPVQLVLSRLLLLGGRDGTPAQWLVALVDAGLVGLAMGLARSLRAELAAGGLVVLWCALQQPWNGHPAELLIGGLGLAAVGWHRRGQTVPAAVALGLASAIAPWAVLIVPALLAVPGLRRALVTGALALALGIGCYLPFVATGHFELFAHRWPVAAASALQLFEPGVGHAGWPVRLAQGVLAAGGCAAVAWRCRGRAAAGPLALATAGLLRLATDPVFFSYYWLPVAVASVFAVARLSWPDRMSELVALVGLGLLPWALAGIGGQPLSVVLPGEVLVLVSLLVLARGTGPAWPRIERWTSSARPTSASPT